MDDRIARAIIGALRERDLSGHELWHWLGPAHGARDELTEATLYPILYRLEAEHVIDGTWREGDGTRRVYRVAGRGVDIGQRRGWPVIVRRTEADPILTQAHERTAAGEATPAVTDKASACGRDYVDRFDAGLRLSEPHRTEVRSEIGEHLEDCSEELVKAGLDPTASVTEAVARLGPPEALAEAVNKAQLTRRRLLEGLRRAGLTALFGGTLGLAGAGMIVLLAPQFARLLTVMAGLVGLHLYVPETAEWRSQQLFVVGWVAAFLAARRSLPFVATYTRREEAAIRPIWALAGAIPLAAVAVLAPASIDALTIVALLGLPVAFAAGTWLSQGPADDLVSRKGLAWATLLLVPLLLAPGFRAWAFDPSSGPTAAPPYAISPATRIAWDGSDLGQNTWRVSVSGLDQSPWHDARLEFWPAVRQGVAIVPDDLATAAVLTISPGEITNLSNIRVSTPEWWVALTAVGPDGVRRTLAADVKAGSPSQGAANLLDWMLRHG
jgi:DNA-binding PadR family transcriptional regulator